MKKLLLFPICLFALKAAYGQHYADSIYKHREHYRNEFVTDERSPLGMRDTSYLRFYAPDKTYRVTASLKLTPEASPFQIPTHSGKTKTYRKYGILHFLIKGKPYDLEVYQSLDLIKKEEYKNHLFVPFNDLTNYEETYGGGRYIDLSITDIIDNTILLDFNKCYNPYCAYAEGYNCPIPPEANRLSIPIKAGEKTFGKKIEE